MTEAYVNSGRVGLLQNWLENPKYGDLVEKRCHFQLKRDPIEHLDDSVVEGARVIAVV